MPAPKSNGPREQTLVRAKPQELGRYLLLERIGGGGMAEIFRATTTGPDRFRRTVVIKRMLPELNSNETFMKMFVDEANICAQLNHPNIVHVHELAVHNGQYFMVMEEINGIDLSRAMKDFAEHVPGVPPCIVADMGRQLARGLSYAHSMSFDGTPMRIIHRDITPTNVMLTSTGVVKILDFGIARAAEAFRVGRTSAGEIKGKCAYLSPEQVAMAPIDHRVDIFAAGVLMHELLLGQRLFKAETPWATIQAVSKMPIPHPSEVDHRIPVGLAEIVLKMLARNPADRYQDAGEIADALDAFLVKAQYQSHELLTFATNICQAPPPRRSPTLTGPARIAVKATVSVVQSPTEPRNTRNTKETVRPTPTTSNQLAPQAKLRDVSASAKPNERPNERKSSSERHLPRTTGANRTRLPSAVGPTTIPAPQIVPLAVPKPAPSAIVPRKWEMPAAKTVNALLARKGNPEREFERTESISALTRIVRPTHARRILTAGVVAYTVWAAFFADPSATGFAGPTHLPSAKAALSAPDPIDEKPPLDHARPPSPVAEADRSLGRTSARRSDIRRTHLKPSTLKKVRDALPIDPFSD